MIQGQLLAVTINPAVIPSPSSCSRKLSAPSRRAIGIKRSWDEISPSREERTLGGSPATASELRRRKLWLIFPFPGITRHPQTRRRSCSARLYSLCSASSTRLERATGSRADRDPGNAPPEPEGLALCQRGPSQHAVERRTRLAPKRARRRRPHLAGRGRGGPRAGLPEGARPGLAPPRRVSGPGPGRSPGTGRAARRAPAAGPAGSGFGPPRPGARPAALTSGGPARRARRTRRRRRRLRSLCLGTSLPSPLRRSPSARGPRRGRGGAGPAGPARRVPGSHPAAATASPAPPAPPSAARCPGVRRAALRARAPLRSPAQALAQSGGAMDTCVLKGAASGVRERLQTPFAGTVPREDRPGSGREAGRPRSPRALRMPPAGAPPQAAVPEVSSRLGPGAEGNDH